jgi:uncharacterized protein (TIGR02266 family)
MSDDRRREPRLPAAPGVVVRVRFKNRRQLKQVWLKDISKGGIFLRTDAPLPPYSQVNIILELPDKTSLEVSGHVVHVIPADQATEHAAAGMGVQFVDLTPAKRALVEQFLDKNRTLLPTSPGAKGIFPPTVPSPAPTGIESLLQMLRRLIWCAGDGAALAEADYYALLGVPASAPPDQIREACAVLRSLLDPTHPPRGVEDVDRARIQKINTTLREIEITLLDPATRLQYDSARLGLLR